MYSGIGHIYLSQLSVNFHFSIIYKFPPIWRVEYTFTSMSCPVTWIFPKTGRVDVIYTNQFQPNHSIIYLFLSFLNLYLSNILQSRTRETCIGKNIFLVVYAVSLFKKEKYFFACTVWLRMIKKSYLVSFCSYLGPYKWS